MLYEDGSPSPPDAYPLAAAVRTEEPQTAVRGHRGPDGAIAWIEVAARPLRHPDDQSVYGDPGSAHRRDRGARLGAPPAARPGPAGARAGRCRSTSPASSTRSLRTCSRSSSRPRRGASAGAPWRSTCSTSTARTSCAWPGPDDFPERLDAPLALGPELAEDGVPELAAHVASELPGVSMAPMWLRGRAIGLLLALGVARRRARRAGPARSRRDGAGGRLHRRVRRGAPAQGDAARRRAAAEPAAAADRAHRRRRDRGQRAARLRGRRRLVRLRREPRRRLDRGGRRGGQGLDGGGARRHRARGSARRAGEATPRSRRPPRPCTRRSSTSPGPSSSSRRSWRAGTPSTRPSAGSAAAIRRRSWCAPTTRSSSS